MVMTRCFIIHRTQQAFKTAEPPYQHRLDGNTRPALFQAGFGFPPP